jgi:VCBS repeat-containing protein
MAITVWRDGTSQDLAVQFPGADDEPVGSPEAGRPD